MNRVRPWLSSIVLIWLALFSIPLPNSYAQKANKLEIEQWRDVLRNVKLELKENYYDPNFHGMDLDARFEQADAKMKSAESLGQLVGIVARCCSNSTTRIHISSLHSTQPAWTTGGEFSRLDQIALWAR